MWIAAKPIPISQDHRRTLERWVRALSVPQGVARRAHIILMAAQGDGLKRELKAYLRYYNNDRAHTGRWTKGRTPRLPSTR